MSYPDFLERIYSSAPTRFHFSSIPPRRLIQGFIVLTLALIPLNAFPQCNVKGDIPFVVTNGSDTETCIQCSGPWLRASTLFFVEVGLKNCQFYAANKGFFDPWGSWTCKLFGVSGTSCTGVLISSVTFCEQSDDDPIGVDLTISNEGKGTFLSVSGKSNRCNEVSVSSFLGDNFKQEKSRPDKDVFLFDGTSGEEIRLTLEPDPAEGNNGGEASLSLSSNSLDESTSGTLPLDINATLPEDAKYSIIVEQPRKPGTERYRGSYMLNLESSSEAGVIEPTSTVEK
jgi:hypothetical protein